MARRPDHTLFSAEEGVIAWAEEVLSQDEGAPASEEYVRLLCEYRKLYRQCTRLVTLGDRMQRQLNALNERLGVSEKKYRDIFRNVGQGIFVSTASGRFLDANPAMARLLGYCDAKEMIAHVTDIAQQLYVDPADRQILLDDLLENGRTQGRALRLKRRDGEIIWAEVFARAEFDGTRLARMQGIVSDITEKRRMLATLKEQARIDALTGLYNRRYFLEICQRELVRTRREARPLSLVYFDVDHFKAVNDTLGHDAGDQVLHTLAQISRAAIRELDVLGRMGGEEFALLLPNTDLDGARCLAEKLRCNFEQCVVRVPCAEVRFTASFGLAAYCDATECVADLVKRADEALYMAKTGGRNTVRTAAEGARAADGCRAT